MITMVAMKEEYIPTETGIKSKFLRQWHGGYFRDGLAGANLFKKGKNKFESIAIEDICVVAQLGKSYVHRHLDGRKTQIM